MADSPVNMRSLCPPALLYLVLSLVVLLYSVFISQESLFSLLGGSLIYLFLVFIWTWILNIICRAGYKWVSWVLVLLPIIASIFVLFVDVATMNRTFTPTPTFMRGYR